MRMKNDLNYVLVRFNGGKVYLWFIICVSGAIATVPVHFFSVEHIKLQEKYGPKKGIKIGEVCGLASGWGFFLFLIGIWISPQPRFNLPVLQNLSIFLSTKAISIPLFHLILGLALLIPGAGLAINGVKETTLRVAETHRTERVITTGVYSIVRHPQYLGALLAHVGISFLLSACYATLVTPLIVALILLISKKEEKELVREFNGEYEHYMKNVPMLIPKLRVQT